MDGVPFPRLRRRICLNVRPAASDIICAVITLPDRVPKMYGVAGVYVEHSRYEKIVRILERVTLDECFSQRSYHRDR